MHRGAAGTGVRKAGASHRKVDLFGGPEARLRFFVHLPHLRVLDGEEHKALLVLHQDGLAGIIRVSEGWHF